MKCPKCGFNSFDFLQDCKKCGADLQEHKAKFGLRSLVYPDTADLEGAVAETDQEIAAETETAGGVDFGFDLMSDDEADADAVAEAVAEAPVSVAEESSEDSSEDDFSFEEEFSDEAAEVAAEDDFEFDVDDVPLEGSEASAPPTSEEVTAEEDDFLSDWDPGPTDADEELSTEETKEPSDPFDLGGAEPQTRLPFSPTVDLAEESVTGQFSDPHEQKQDPETLPETAPEEVAEPISAFSPLPETVAAEDASLLDDLEQDSIAFSAGVEDEVEADQPESAVDVPVGGFGFQGAERLEEGPVPEPSVAESEAPDEEDPAYDEDAPAVVAGQVSRRLFAGGIDFVLLGAAFLLFLCSAEMFIGSAGGTFTWPQASTLTRLAVPYFLVLFALGFGYFTLFHYLVGQTPGKMWCRLRVEGDRGEELQLSQAFLRSVGGLICLLPVGLGYLSVFLSRDGRGWNDRLAGSRLVRVVEVG